MANDSANKDNIKGIWFEKEYMRTYPYDSLAAAMIGYCNVEDQAHSSYAQEIAKNVLEQILPYMNIDRVDVDPVD